jgi:hypothetical protein
VQSRRKNELENQINESGPAEVGIWSYHQKLVPKTNIQCQQSISALEMNLKYYLSQPVQSKYKDLAPKITEIAFQFLSLVGTSVPSERLDTFTFNILRVNKISRTRTLCDSVITVKNNKFK